jgi:hypothetical protein
VRNDGVYEMVRMEGDLYVFAAGATEEIRLSRDLMPVTSVTLGSTELEFLPAPSLPWPLRVGQTGTAKGTVREARYRSVPVPGSLRWAVEAHEEVAVPAGRFQAFRLVFDVRDEDTPPPGSAQGRGFYQPDVRTRWRFRLWYAPEVGQFVKGESNDVLKMNFVILAVGPGEAAPLTLRVDGLADGIRVTDGKLLVSGMASAGRRITMLTVEVNDTGVLVEDRRRVPLKELSCSTFVQLREGANTLVVTATDGTGATQRATRTIVLDRGATGPRHPAESPSARPAPNRWAVVIGVGNYESRSIAKLNYAVADAEAMYQVLTGPAGFRKEHVLLLTDRTPQRPTLRNIRWALGTFLARSAQKNDTVVIFFAGHGAPEIDQRGAENDGLSKYLVPIDADPDDLFLSALAMDDLHTILGRIEAQRVVMFVDACYSGAAGGRTFASHKTRAGQVDEAFLERLASSKGRAILMAARSNEVSLEMSELGHGLFSYYLIGGLRGAADLNRDGIVTLQELYDHVAQEVPRRSRAVGANQHPVMKGELEGTMPLVQTGAR